MASNSIRAAALLIAATVTLTACASPGAPTSTGAGRADQPTAVSSPSAQQLDSAAAGAATDGLEIGQRAPAFAVTGLDGQQISDVNLRGQGKPYILYFYATW